jgi:hypothetical protein
VWRRVEDAGSCAGVSAARQMEEAGGVLRGVSVSAYVSCCEDRVPTDILIKIWCFLEKINTKIAGGRDILALLL